MKNIVVFGEFDSHNIGDQLIGEGTKILFEGLGFACKTYPLEPRSRDFATEPRDGRVGAISRIHRWLYRRQRLYAHLTEFVLIQRSFKGYSSYLHTIIESSDLIVIGGGQLLSDNTLRMMLRISWILNISRRLGKNVMFVGLGVREPRSALSKWLLRSILKRAGTAPLIVRDNYSAAIAAAHRRAEQPPPRVLPDCAFPAIQQLAKSIGSVPDALLVGLAPMSSIELPYAVAAHPINSTAWWADIAETFIAAGYRPQLFCSGTSADFDKCKDVQNLLAKRGRSVPILEKPRSSRQLLDQLQSMGHILSQRLHISIAYLALGRAPTSISWDRKVDEFYEANGLANRVVRERDADPNRVCQLVIGGSSMAGKGDLLANQLREGVAEALATMSINPVIPRNAEPFPSGDALWQQ